MSRNNRLGFAMFGGALALTAAATAMLSVGCTVLTNGTPLDDAGTYEGGADGGSAACGACLADACTGAWAVCLTDESCRAVRACTNPRSESAAGEKACACSVEAGADAATSAQAAYEMFAACNDARTCSACATDCASACANGGRVTTVGSCEETDAGDAGDAALPVTVEGCASCVTGNCGDPRKACANGTECAAYLGCVHACVGPSCVNECEQKHATGKVAAVALASCAHTACSAACGL